MVLAPARTSRPRAAAAVLIALVAGVAGVLSVVAPPAQAGPVDVGWAASGPGLVTTVSDGTSSAAAFTYNGDGNGSGQWDFIATATPASSVGPIKVPWTWSGLHAWFDVTARLDMIVDGVVVGAPLVDAGPAICCTTPSNGFLYGGVTTFDIPASPGPHTYGFRLSGANSDYNNFLRGTFTLSTKPYIDATIGTDNRQWVGATELPAAGLDGLLLEPGEARWYKIPVVPGQNVNVDLTNLPLDYDLGLYGDIQAAFDQLSAGNDVTQLAAGSAAPAPTDGTTLTDFPSSVTTVPTGPPSESSTTFAPRIYAPRIYAPRIYAPRIYAPDAYVPDLSADPAFSEAFSAAQNQTLLAVSANTANQSETVSANSGNTQGYFYVRVQGHTDAVSSTTGAYHVQGTVTGGAACTGLTDKSGIPTLAPTSTTATTVILTDTNKLGLTAGSTEAATYLASLQALATAQNGVVVDVSTSPRVQALQDQVADHATCPYATNLVASAIRQIANSYRNTNSRYVVIAGGDEVIPFFRYPDTSGLGQESQFSPPMLPDSPAGASLANDQVLSQDAYGSKLDVTIGGATVPVADLAVGRLVKTPDEIESTVAHFLGLSGGNLPLTGTNGSSLVTGYDFLTDAATAVGQQFAAALPGGVHDELIAPADQAHEHSWTGTDLKNELFDRHHDLVYLAGHFSANDTLAADFTTTFDADELDPAVNPGKLTDTVVLSAGCHSGYNIVDGQAPLTTNPFDWAQRMAQQHAVLVGGTGYQYGDTDFLEYSERLYLDLARRLHEGPVDGDSPAIPVGRALVLAKQDYLASLTSLTGIDQKAVLQSTLYGLPMTGFDAPGRSPLGGGASASSPTPVGSGPGAVLGLKVGDQTFTTPTTEGHKDQTDVLSLPDQLTWLDGKDGVTVQPGAPALPKQVENVTVSGQVLRGVGFRSGAYTDTTNVLPLTGAPAIEGSTANTTFNSPAFFPQELATANYFGALGDSGRTSLILTPGQYRNDVGTNLDAPTNTQRAYSNLDVRLFYSPPSTTGTGANRPALAAPPSIGGVSGLVSNGVVTFTATVTGDPSAGVQQVWVTWTGGPGSDGHGTWASVDLVQDVGTAATAGDSTKWTGTLALPSGQDPAKIRFLVQAANGLGSIGLDTAEGDGYLVRDANLVDTSSLELRTGSPSEVSPLGVVAHVEDAGHQPVADRAIVFTVERGGATLFTYASTTDADGDVVLLPDGEPPFGRLSVTAVLYDVSGQVQETKTAEVVMPGVNLALTPSYLTTRAGTAFGAGVTATLTDKRGPLAGVPVTFTLPAPGGTGATFPGGTRTVTLTTNPLGVVTSPVPTADTPPGAFGMVVTADGAVDATMPLAAQYAFTTFSGDVSNTGPTVINGNSPTAVRVGALLANGTKIPDAAAAQLVGAGRVQLRWRQVGTTAWSSMPGMVTYDASADVFKADPRAHVVGWAKNKNYTVQLRILPAATDPLPLDPLLQTDFDLGGRSFIAQIGPNA